MTIRPDPYSDTSIADRDEARFARWDGNDDPAEPDPDDDPMNDVIREEEW